ncbi:MAG: GGDEF domain-containing protein [Thermoleophilaceae bacterium]|nr:GGDEF domain-containing protein [Thermoleophilaceae bacterium]
MAWVVRALGLVMSRVDPCVGVKQLEQRTRASRRGVHPHGHPTGDLVLRTVARAAQGAVRKGDCLARIGGDEFAVIAPGAERDGADRLVQALAEQIEAAPMPEGLDRVGITFAAAVSPIDADDGESLPRRVRPGTRRRAAARCRPRSAPRPGAGRRPCPSGRLSC